MFANNKRFLRLVEKVFDLDLEVNSLKEDLSHLRNTRIVGCPVCGHQTLGIEDTPYSSWGFFPGEQNYRCLTCGKLLRSENVRKVVEEE